MVGAADVCRASNRCVPFTAGCLVKHRTSLKNWNHKQQKSLQSFRGQNLLARASGTPESPSDGEERVPQDAPLPIEQQIAKRKPKAVKSNNTQPVSPSYKVVSATRDQVYGDGPQTSQQRFENGVVSFLAFLFFVILGEGVFLAASGFLNEEADKFAQNVVYPAFSPTMILFLASSTLYGLWKTGGLGQAGSKDDSRS
jgi:hypothetical protein